MKHPNKAKREAQRLKRTAYLKKYFGYSARIYHDESLFEVRLRKGVWAQIRYINKRWKAELQHLIRVGSQVETQITAEMSFTNFKDAPHIIMTLDLLHPRE